MTFSLDTKAKLACLYAGACWGVFWIPLRALQDAGLHPLWTTAVYFLIPALFLLPVLLMRWRHVLQGGLGFQFTVIISGMALTLYSAAIVYTDVVRAIVLFYLMPIWSILLARIVLGEAITPIRIAAMALALIGMMTIFGLGFNFPIPRNAGDWMGLAAGILWSVAMIRLRLDQTLSSVDLTVGFFLWSFVIASMVALLLAPSHIPNVAQVLPVLPLLLIFMLFIVIPGSYASLWGPKFLNPGIVGLLFMTEIVVGSISAAILSGDPFGSREVIGVLLITGASLLEPLSQLRRERRIH